MPRLGCQIITFGLTFLQYGQIGVDVKTGVDFDLKRGEDPPLRAAAAPDAIQFAGASGF
jgi:hypothetical protein